MKFLRRFIYFLAVLAIVSGAVGFLLHSRSVAAVQPIISTQKPAAASKVDLPWPAYGQAAVGGQGFGLLASHGPDSPVPIASVAKVITALSVLKQKPLAAGAPGPNITISASDVEFYRQAVAQDGSVIPVSVGQEISEYQALAALLLPSANNIAATLANWAFGSLDNYVAFANNYVKTIGMSKTYVGDASGFSPNTTSTAKDLIALSQAALANPLLASVVSQAQADFPNIGTIKNTNWLLGNDGVIGIKTGNTDQAGGCFLLAAKQVIGAQPITIFVSVLGAANLQTAVTDAKNLLTASKNGFEVITAVKKNDKIGYYNLPWGGNIYAVAAYDVPLVRWKEAPINQTAKLDSLIVPANREKILGAMKVSSGPISNSVPAVLREPVPNPPWTWRLFH